MNNNWSIQPKAGQGMQTVKKHQNKNWNWKFFKKCDPLKIKRLEGSLFQKNKFPIDCLIWRVWSIEYNDNGISWQDCIIVNQECWKCMIWIDDKINMVILLHVKNRWLHNHGSCTIVPNFYPLYFTQWKTWHSAHFMLNTILFNITLLFDSMQLVF